MRPSLAYLIATLLLCCIALAVPLHAVRSAGAAQQRLAAAIAPLRGLGLTDLCLTTEARYTRHPALSDRHAPFQEHPGALEHFPSGALLLPPAVTGGRR